MLAHGLTPRQASFVKNISKGMNQTLSAKMAGYAHGSADVVGSRLMRNLKIIKALERQGITDDYIAKTLKENIDAGSKVKPTADVALRGLDIATRLKGYQDREEKPNSLNQTNIYINELKQLSDTQLEEKLKKIQQDIRELQS